MSLPAPWPDVARLSADRRYNLPDGGRVSIRPFQPEDRAAVGTLLERLSAGSLYNRFHSACVRITEPLLDLMTAGHTLVAEVEGHMVALASWHPLPDGWQAEIGVVVDDLNQRRGIGTILCHALCRDARGAGIRRLRAELLGSNHAMLGVLRGLGFPATYRTTHGVVEVAIEPLRAAGSHGSHRRRARHRTAPAHGCRARRRSVRRDRIRASTRAAGRLVRNRARTRHRNVWKDS